MGWKRSSKYVKASIVARAEGEASPRQWIAYLLRNERCAVASTSDGAGNRYHSGTRRVPGRPHGRLGDCHDVKVADPKISIS